MRFVFLLLLVLPSAAQTAADFFSDAVLHEVRIEINPKDLKALTDNYLDNTYYPINVTWNNITVENAGARSKGRTSRRAAKPGLRIDLDRFEEQRFLGLKSFLLDNNISDYTGMKEPLCMLMFRKMGLPAPRETHAKVYVNGEYHGLYAIVESTDKLALMNWFGNDDGYLYEWVPIYQYYFGYLGPDPASYSPTPFKPETHEKDPEPKPLEAMLRAINESSDGEFQDQAGKYLDLKRFLTHMAVESYMAEFDGILADDGVNNLYFYRLKNSNLGYVLPKDKDLAIRSPELPMLANIKNNVLMRRLMDIPEMKQFYTDEILRAASIAGDEGGWLETEMDRIYARIREAMLADPLKECQIGVCPLEQSNVDFERFFEFIRQFPKQRRAFVEKELRDAGYPMRTDDPPEISQAGSGGSLPAGSAVVIRGRNLARHSVKASEPWPYSMGTTQVEFGGRKARLLRVSPDEVEVQVPGDISPGRATMVLTNAGGRSAELTLDVSAPVEVVQTR